MALTKTDVSIVRGRLAKARCHLLAPKASKRIVKDVLWNSRVLSVEICWVLIINLMVAISPWKDGIVIDLIPITLKQIITLDNTIPLLICVLRYATPGDLVLVIPNHRHCSSLGAFSHFQILINQAVFVFLKCLKTGHLKLILSL